MRQTGSDGVNQLCELKFWLVLNLEERLEERIEHMKKESNKKKFKRIIEISNNYFTFAFAWCIFFGAKWGITATLTDLNMTKEEALIAVCLALLLSACAFAFIFILDKLMDGQFFGEEAESADDAVEKMITALGILIGFSWEQCFDTAVTVIAEGKAEHYVSPAITKLFLSVLLVLIVFPAWRWYILPTEQELIGEDTEEQVKLKAAAGHLREYFLDKNHDEHVLDHAHLRMKEHRREAFNQTHPSEYAGKNLTHVRVTVKGITTVLKQERKDSKEKNKKRAAAHIDQEKLTANLLLGDHEH